MKNKIMLKNKVCERCKKEFKTFFGSVYCYDCTIAKQKIKIKRLKDKRLNNK